MEVVNNNSGNININMKYTRQIAIISLIIFPLAALVLIRTTTSGRFKYNARKLAEPSFHNTNKVKGEQLSSMKDICLIIDLSDSASRKTFPVASVNIPYRSLAGKDGQKIIRAHKGSLVLFSNDPGTSARAWMLLSQMGYRKLYILAGDTDNELMKYRFIPDSTRAEIVF